MNDSTSKEPSYIFKSVFRNETRLDYRRLKSEVDEATSSTAVLHQVIVEPEAMAIASNNDWIF